LTAIQDTNIKEQTISTPKVTDKAINKIKSSRFKRPGNDERWKRNSSKESQLWQRAPSRWHQQLSIPGKTCSNCDTLNHYAQCCMKDPANRHRELTLKEEEIVFKSYVD